jgi:hypothetical protein
MGELMRSSLSNVCCVQIAQLELSRFFTMTEKGVVALTRSAEDVKHSDSPFKEAIIGTFNFTPEKLLVFARKMDLQTGRILRMSSREIDFSCNEQEIGYQIR